MSFMSKMRELSDSANKAAETIKFDGKCPPWRIAAGKLYRKASVVDAAGMVWEVESGAQQKRITVTRAATLGLFAPLVKKKSTSVYLMATTADGEQFLDEYPIKQEAEVRKFVAKARSLGARKAAG